MAEPSSARRMVAVLAAACLLAVFAAPRAGADVVRPPVVGPEHRVSNPIESPSGSVAGGDIAFDGTNHLVVWTDGRSGTSSGADVYGARVTPDGVLLDPTGIRIGSGPGDQAHPSVAFGDGSFLVVWSGNLQNGLADVHGARVSPAGTVLDPSPIPISTAASDQLDVDVAYGDGTFLAVWTDHRSGDTSDVYGSRVTPAGEVLDGSGIAISTGPPAQDEPAVAFGAGSFLVAWTDYRAGAADVFGARVDQAGAVLDPAGVPIGTGPGYQWRPDLAFNGTHHLVSWQEYLEPGWTMFASRVDPAGTVVDPSPIAVALSDQPFGGPAVTSLGPTFLVAWQAASSGDQSDALGARIDSDGTNLDPSGFVIASATGRLGGIYVGAGRSTYFAAWDDARIGRPEIFGTALAADGSPSGPGTLLTRSANDQVESAIAFDGENHLVVWSDNRSGARNEIMATRMSPSGRKLDRFDIPVSGGASGSSPAVALGYHDYFGNFVVVWQDANRISLTRVDASGNVVGPPILVPGPPDPQILLGFAIAANPLGIIVTWSDVNRGENSIRAVRVAHDGTILDPVPLLIALERGPFLGNPSVASDGRDFLVAWTRRDGVSGARVTADGTVLDPDGFSITTTPNAQYTSVAWNGQRYFVVWNTVEPADDPVDEQVDVQGARVTVDAVVQDPVPIAVSTEPGNQRAPVVTAGTGPFLVAWRHTDDEAISDIRGARVSDGGAVLDVPSFPIATSGEPELDVALSPGPGATWGASYTRFVPESPYSAERVFFRSVSPK